VGISVFDLFKVGVGPSSSHTVGPMLAANRFARCLEDRRLLTRVSALRVELFGSLGATGHGHGSVPAVVLGLLGHHPETVDPALTGERVDQVHDSGKVDLLGAHSISFDIAEDIVLHRRERLPFHTNALTFTAWDVNGGTVSSLTYYSVGGGFVLDEEEAAESHVAAGGEESSVPYPFTSAEELLEHADREGLRVSDVVLANEQTWRTEGEVRTGLLWVWRVMQECVDEGTRAAGVLPGGLSVRRRARSLRSRLVKAEENRDPLDLMDWVALYAMSVNEENAAGGRVVTAPTNGAAGVIPAVLHYYANYCAGADDDGVVRFLLTAGGIGALFKENASISGAEVGCQGEVGSACAMAAAGLAELLGGTPQQVENAAEIGIEHNLGLTCDPVGGLVQIPCIERNGVAAIKAIAAARLAVRGDGAHHVSLDKAIKTMRETGADMMDKYKETSRGGLAVNVVEC
jgi:L-serine dehydratase